MKYNVTKKDKKELKALLTFLSGITEDTPIKGIEFIKKNTSDIILVHRYTTVSKNEFQTIKQSIRKSKKNT